MSAGCRDCRAGWEHCHGTVIVHVQRRAECTEVDCDGPERVPHAFAIDCDVVGCACGHTIAVAV